MQVRVRYQFDFRAIWCEILSHSVRRYDNLSRAEASALACLISIKKMSGIALALLTSMQNLTTVSKQDFSFLDTPQLHTIYASNAAENAIRFFIGGISCAKCVRKLEDLPMTLPGLEELRVDMSTNVAYAKMDLHRLAFSGLAEAISALGFVPYPIPGNENSIEFQVASDRRELKRLAVAGAIAGNIMVFSFATYFGDAGELIPLFRWLSFLLYLPVVTYVAWPFYVGAISSLRRRELSIDLPMAVASFAGFLFSTIELTRGQAEVYFDSLSGFLFLILISRWGQRKIQKRYLKAEQLIETFRLQRVRKLVNGQSVWSPTERLEVEDQIRLIRGETLPCDAQLLSSTARFGMAWLSGEEKAKTYTLGSKIPAGARLDTSEADFLVETLLPETDFGRILSEVEKFALSKNRIVSLSDKWAQYLLATVFSVAILFLIFYWPNSNEEAIRRALALIILACPCALAFGTPLAISAALKKASRSGVIVRDANVFEKVKTVDTIFFDKTGTLTDTDLTLSNLSTYIPDIHRRIILGLEHESVHPIAFAFRKAFAGNHLNLPLEKRREVSGRGVSAYLYGRLFELRRSEEASDTVSCALYEEGKLLFTFRFESKIKDGCLELLQDLRERGLKIVLLSGDRKESVDRLTDALGFDFDQVISEADPAHKHSVVSRCPNSIFVGDGVNDSLAMIKSKISIAVSGGVESALRSSDVYLTEPSLKGVGDLLRTGDEAMILIRQNLSISFIYNVAGGTLALMGYVNPLVAALLMPASSGLIILSTWLRSRE